MSRMCPALARKSRYPKFHTIDFYTHLYPSATCYYDTDYTKILHPSIKQRR